MRTGQPQMPERRGVGAQLVGDQQSGCESLLLVSRPQLGLGAGWYRQPCVKAGPAFCLRRAPSVAVPISTIAASPATRAGVRAASRGYDVASLSAATLDTGRPRLFRSEGSGVPRSPHRSGRAACWLKLVAINGLMFQISTICHLL